MSALINSSSVVRPQLAVKEIKDVIIRKNFQNLQDYFMAENQLMGFQFFDVTFTKAQTNFILKHGLSYTPQDVVVLQCVGAGQVSFNVGIFSTSSLNITTTGACRVRFLVGSYWNQQGSVANAKTDIITFNQPSSLTTALKAPNVIRLLSGNGQYVPSAGCLYFEIEAVGPGGGGAAANGGAAAGAKGPNTTFGGFLICPGGGPGAGLAGGIGGTPTCTATTGVQILKLFKGGDGQGADNVTLVAGGNGGVTPLGGAGSGSQTGANGSVGVPGTGSGSGGGGGSGTVNGGAGGGAGGYALVLVSTPFLTAYPYFIGTAGLAGSGIKGSDSSITIKEYFQ